MDQMNLHLNHVIQQQISLIAQLSQDLAAKNMNLHNLQQVLHFKNAWERDQRTAFDVKVSELTKLLDDANGEILRLKTSSTPCCDEKVEAEENGGKNDHQENAKNTTSQACSVEETVKNDKEVEKKPQIKIMRVNFKKKKHKKPSKKLCHDEETASTDSQSKNTKIKLNASQMSDLKNQIREFRKLLDFSKREFRAVSITHYDSLKTLGACIESSLQELATKNTHRSESEKANVIGLCCTNIRLSQENAQLGREKSQLEEMVKRNYDVLCNEVARLIKKIEKGK